MKRDILTIQRPVVIKTTSMSFCGWSFFHRYDRALMMVPGELLCPYVHCLYYNYK